MRSRLKCYSPSHVLKGIKLLYKYNLGNRLIFTILSLSFSTACKPLLNVSIGLTFGYDFGVGISALTLVLANLVNIALPLFKDVKIRTIMISLFILDTINVIILGLTLGMDSKELMIIGLNATSVIASVLVIAFGVKVETWVAESKVRRKLIKPYRYILIGLDTLVDTFIGLLVIVLTIVNHRLPIVLAILLSLVCMIYQVRFMKDMGK